MINYLFGVIVRVKVVFRKTDVSTYLSSSHLQSQVKGRRQIMVFMPLVLVWIGQFCRDVTCVTWCDDVSWHDQVVQNVQRQYTKKNKQNYALNHREWREELKRTTDINNMKKYLFILFIYSILLYR